MEEVRKVLDKGFVKLIDTMGTCESVANAARVSYSKGTKALRDDKKLIEYLWKHRHTSPFEMVEFKFHVKLPIFVARQWMRHRTGSFNEISARYSVVEDEYYSPDIDDCCYQDTKNKQQRAERMDQVTAQICKRTIDHACDAAYKVYGELMSQGLARELARIVLPTAFYTEFIWKIDCNNLLKFIKLRTGDGAQLEIRKYAEAIVELIEPKIPMIMEAYRKFS